MIFAMLVGLVISTSTTTAAAADTAVTLVSPNQKPLQIHYPADASSLEKLAANELASYLTKISGQTFTASPFTDRGRVALPAIIVGQTAAALPNSIEPDGYVIRASAKSGLEIAGLIDRGTIYGVYGFLEDQLGCHFWAWDAEDVPTTATIALPALDIASAPAFRTHHIFNKEAENPKNNFAWKRRTNGYDGFSGGHTICPFLKPYAEDNPEFLPMDKNGQRKFNNLHMCYTAPGMADALAIELGKQVEKSKADLQRLIYFAGMGDWYGGMCQCERCTAVYEAEKWTDPDGREKPGYIAPLVKLINETGAILEEKYPGVRVGTFNYMSLEAPPAHQKPNDNVYLRMPHLRHCITHGIDECDHNRNFYVNLERWLELAPDRMYIWDYGISFANFMYPMPNIRAMAENIKAYHRMGVSGVMIQGNYVSTGGDMAVLRNYVWSKLLWDPSLDYDAVLQDFCEGYYGPAANDILAYVRLIEHSVRSPAMIHFDEFERNLAGKWLTEELATKLESHIASALKNTGSDATYVNRVKDAKVSMETFRLWNTGPLVEQGDRLVRKDLGDTWTRAQDLVKHARGSSPREWGSGRAYRMNFLTNHGGPLPSLKSGDLEVKVSPTLNGRIRRLIWNGRDLLHVPDADKKENNNSSGAYEMLKPHAILYTLEDSVAADAATMSAELGIANWGSGTKAVATKSVHVAGSTVIITGVVRQIERSTTAVTAMPVTEYAAGKDFTRISLQYQTAEGQWVYADVPNETPKPKTPRVTNLPAFKAIRITLEQQGAIVTEAYGGQIATAGRVWFDADRGVLAVEVDLPATSISPGGEVSYLNRTMTVHAAK